MKIDPSLCVRCKGYKMLCGRPVCPILERFRASMKAVRTVGREFSGPTPPSALVGERGYPRVRVGINLVTIGGRDPRFFDLPEAWWGRVDIREVIRLRSSMVFSYSRWRVDRPGRLLDALREASLSTKPVEVEVTYSKAPRPSLRFDSVLQPVGPSALVKRLRLASNPSTPRIVDRVVYDTDLRAEQAMLTLYRGGVSLYEIIRLLSLGMLGARDRRRLVPTRWAITAVDVTLGDRLKRRVSTLPEIEVSELRYVEYLGNRYWLLLLPGPYMFELYEVWRRGTLWTGEKDEVVHYWEASRISRPSRISDGGYFAARLGVLEHLSKRGRRASALLIREVTPSYYVPVGNWQIRESVRNMLRMEPTRFSSWEEAIASLEKIFGSLIRDSAVITYLRKQKKMF